MQIEKVDVYEAFNIAPGPMVSAQSREGCDECMSDRMMDTLGPCCMMMGLVHLAF